MEKELFVSTRGKTHAVALTENGKVIEFTSESEDDASIVGNIYKGKVEQVLKGMQAAFVNIGREKNAYMSVGEQTVSIDAADKLFENAVIDKKRGDSIMVQVTKTEIGTKGARISPNVSIAGRYLVYMPTVDYIGISRKITDEEKKTELISLLENLEGRKGGYIIRTASAKASKEDILRDAEKLRARFEKILEEYEKTPVGECCYKEGGVIFRMVRDVVSSDVKRIVVDDRNTYDLIKNYLSELGLCDNVLTLFSETNMDLFNSFGLSAQILRLLDSKVELENGGYLVIEETEALTVIDVNTGRFTGSENLEETVFETNLEAAQAVAAQLRLRNIGGIIIVDFIDMTSEDHKNAVMNVLSECVQRDRVRTNVIDMTSLGLVEITRKKTNKEIVKRLSKPCPVCGGKGYIMTNETLHSYVRAKLFDTFSDESVTSVLIMLSRENAEEFFEGRAFTFEISVFWQNKRIYVCPDDTLGQDSVEIKCFKEDVISLPDEAKMLY